MKNTALLVVVAAMCLCLVCCKSEVESKSIVFSSDPPKDDELCLATMDALLLESPSDDSQVLTQVREGDHLNLLEVQDKWGKATHTPSGMTGWIHSGAWTMRKQSKFWSGDTVKARTVANRIYLASDLDPLQLIHIKVHEGSHTMTLYGSPENIVDVETAKKTSCQWHTRINEYFTDWSERSIVFVGYTETEHYTVMCHGELETSVIERKPYDRPAAPAVVDAGEGV
jgi:hypothetical protein